MNYKSLLLLFLSCSSIILYAPEDPKPDEHNNEEILAYETDEEDMRQEYQPHIQLQPGESFFILETPPGSDDENDQQVARTA